MLKKIVLSALIETSENVAFVMFVETATIETIMYQSKHNYLKSITVCNTEINHRSEFFWLATPKKFYQALKQPPPRSEDFLWHQTTALLLTQLIFNTALPKTRQGSLSLCIFRCSHDYFSCDHVLIDGCQDVKKAQTNCS